MSREALDDYRRYSRDKEANSLKYKKLTRDGIVQAPSSDIKVGDLIIVEKVYYYQFCLTYDEGQGFILW